MLTIEEYRAMDKLVTNRYDFVYMIGAHYGCLNRDRTGLPRYDPINGKGWIHGAAVKNRIKNVIDLVSRGTPGYAWYINNNDALNSMDADILKTLGYPSDQDGLRKLRKKDPKAGIKIRDAFCSTFYNIRMNGIPVTTLSKANYPEGQIKGAVQVYNAFSVDPVQIEFIDVPRKEITKEEDYYDKCTEFGSYAVVRDALYVGIGSVSVPPCKTNHVTEGDLRLYFDAFKHICDFSNSAMEGDTMMKKLILFKHDSWLGSDMRRDQLVKAVHVDRKYPEDPYAVGYDDYDIWIDHDAISKRVEVIELI